MTNPLPRPPSPRRTARVGVLVALVLLAGCAQLSVHSTVGGDGTIEEYRVQINTSRTVYGFIEQSATEDGYDSVRASFLDGIDESRAESVEYDESFDGDRVTVTITLLEYDPDDGSGISVTETDGTIVYEDRSFVNESAQQSMVDEGNLSGAVTAGLAVDYYLTMPGEIVDSNADEVDGNTAEWHATGPDAFVDNRIYAESEPPTAPGQPGFGVGVALAAVAGGALLRRRLG